MSDHHPAPRRAGFTVTALAALAALALAVGAATALGGDDPQPIDFSHNVVNAPAPVPAAVFGQSPSTKTGTAICTTGPQSGPNFNTDCEGQTTTFGGPHNETSIAVNPTDPNNMIGGANDYQLGLNPGGHVSETVLSRAHVTFDGGNTWSEYPVVSNSAYQATGDPALAFDADGRAYYGTLGFRFVGPFNATNPDVLVSTSGDKGKAWDVDVVAAGSGSEGSVGDLLDKEYVAAWGHGNAIVTYGDFRADAPGAFTTARIYDSVTHDGGATWSAPTLISGSLDQSFVSVPTVAADGKIYVAFLNTTDLATGRDDYEVVRVSPTTGAAVTAPVKVATVIDGFDDYPVALGRQTYQDSVFRSWAAGNITADPTNASHLAVVWSDMRNSPPPSPDLNPYTSVTNSDVIVSESTDGGAHWSAPQAVMLPGDQFQQWAAFDKNGVLRIGTFDRSYDPANHKYGFTVLTKTGSGFASTQVTDTLSDPTKNDRWFARNLNPAFPNATAFLGDYANIATTPDGGVVAYWTDMRNPANFGGVTRSGEDAYFGKTG
jgi:hypothetical protein